MNLKKLKKEYERKIFESATSEQVEEEMLDKLESIFDELNELENQIEEQEELSDEWRNYLTSERMEEEFMYANRMC